MAIIGSASVVIRAITNKLESDIEKGLGPAVRRAGDNAGKDLGSSLEKGIKNVEISSDAIRTDKASKGASDRITSDISSALKKPTTITELNLKASAASRRATDKLISDMNANLRAANLKVAPPRDMLADWRLPEVKTDRAERSFDDYWTRVTSGGRKAEREVSSTMNRIVRSSSDGGSRSGTGFIQGFGQVDISSYMKRTFYQMLFGVPVIGALVGALSTLVSGLFAVGAAIGPALNGFAVLPGLLGAATAGIGSVLLAFGGVSKAFSAGNKAISGVGGAAKSAGVSGANNANRIADAYEQAAERIADAQTTAAEKVERANRAMAQAQERLNDVISGNARDVLSSQRSLRDAQESLTRSQLAATRAQQGINAARAEALNTIKELQFSVEGAAIAEGQAVITLERAREKLAEVNELPPNHRLRREAELAYQEADLNLRRAQKNNEDLAKEQEESAKKGVEGSDAVVDAIQDEIDAQRDLRDAKEAAQDAADSAMQTELRNARDLRDARQDIIDIEQDYMDIQKDLTDSIAKANKDLAKTLRDVSISAGAGGGGAAGGIDAFAEAMKKLSPEAQSFVRYMLSVKDVFKAVRDEAGRELFPKLETAIGRLINGGFLDVLSDALRTTGGVMGDLAIKIADLVSQPFFQGTFTKFMESNNTVLALMGDTIVNLIDFFTTLGAAAAPMTEAFARWVATVTGNWASNARNNFTGLQDKMTESMDVIKQLGDIFGNLWTIIKNVGEAARPAGQLLLDAFETATGKLAELTGSAEGQNKLKEYFDAIVPNMLAVSAMIGDIALAFTSLGDNPAIAKVADIVSARVIPAITELLDLATAEVGPAMAEAFASIVEVFEVLATSGGLEAFVSTIGFAADALSKLTSIPGFATFIGVFAAFVGTYKALSLITSVPVAMVQSAIAFKTFASGAITKASTAISSFLVQRQLLDAPPSKFQAAMTSIGTGLTNMKTKLIAAGTAVKTFVVTQATMVAAGVRSAAAWVASTAALVAHKAAAVAANVATKAMAAGQWLLNAALTANPIGLIIAAIAALVAAFIYAWNNIDGFKEFFVGMWEGIKKAWSGVSKFFSGLWDGVINIFKKVISVGVSLFLNFTPQGLIIKHWGAITAFFSSLWNNVLGIFKTVITNIGSVLSTWVAAIVAIPGNIASGLANMWDALSNGLVAAVAFINGLIEGLVAFVLGLPATLLTGLSTIWDAIWKTLSAAVGLVQAGFNGMMTFIMGLPGKVVTAVSTIWNIMYSPVAGVVSSIQTGFNNLISWVTGLPGRVSSALGSMWSSVSSGATTAKDWAISKMNELINWVGSLSGTITTKASGMWDGIKTAFKSALNWIIGKWNGLSFKLPKFEAFGQTIGGTTISVPQIPLFAKGGVVAPSPGGTLGIIAEAGRSERITPLDADGLSAGERMMLEALNSRQSGDINIQIVAQPGQDIQLLAKLVSRELAFKG